MRLFFALAAVMAVSGFQVGEIVCVGNAGSNLRNSPCGTVVTTSSGSERGTVKSVTRPASCALGNYTWVAIQLLNSGPTYFIAQETAQVHSCGVPTNVGKLINNVPYISQQFDVGDDFDGDWACGPTSTLMALAHFGKLTKKPLHSSRPWSHSNDLGWQDFTTYTSPIKFTFSATRPDPKGREFAGAWGSCVKEGGAWAYLIQDFVRHHGGLSATFYDHTNFTMIKTAIDRNQLVIQSTQIRGAGHLVVVRGYTTDGRVIVNDPWGDANGVRWGNYPNGEAVTYTWSLLAAKWCVIVAPLAETTEAGDKMMDMSPDAPRDAWVPFNPKRLSEY